MLHTPVQNVCTASTPIVPWFCIACIPASTPPSSSSWLFYGRRVLFGRRSPIACGRSGVFLGRRGKPVVWEEGDELARFVVRRA